jgi:hypothetical protein
MSGGPIERDRRCSHSVVIKCAPHLFLASMRRLRDCCFGPSTQATSWPPNLSGDDVDESISLADQSPAIDEMGRFIWENEPPKR